MALHLSNSFYASRQRNSNNKTFLSDFITWFCVKIPRGDFHSFFAFKCTGIIYVQFTSFSLMLNFFLCNLEYRVISIPGRRTKVSTKRVEGVSERSDKRSQTSLGNCFSKVKDESRREVNLLEADTNPSLTFHLPQEEPYSWGLERWDSEACFH